MTRMNLKKYVKMANKAYIAVALSIVVTTGSISLVTFAKNPTAPVQTNIYNIIGDAAYYGIICNKLSVNADMESNFASDHVIFAGQADSGNSTGKFTNVGGTIYMKELTSGTIQLYPTNNLVVGTNYTIDGTNLTFENGSRILLANSSGVNVAFDPDYMNVDATIDEVSDSVNEYTADDTTEGAVVSLSDMNNAVIDVRNCADSICTVYVPLSQYKCIQPGGLKFYKNDNQAIIIKLVNDGAVTYVNDEVTNLVTENVYINRYFINGTNSASDNALNSDTIIWNLSDFNDTIITISEGCGIFVAPEANIALGGCGRGHIVSKFFTNSGNEWHFLSDNLSEETSTLPTETTTEEVTTTPVTVPETTTEEVTTTPVTVPETTTEEVTTTPVTVPETTTEEVTTTPVTVPETTTEEVTTTPVTVPETTTEEVTTTPVTVPETTTEEVTTAPVTVPETTKPHHTEPETTKPHHTEPETTKPHRTEPETTKPHHTEPETVTRTTEEETTTKVPEITSTPYEEENTTTEEVTTKKPTGILGTEIVKETTTNNPTKKGEVLGMEIVKEKKPEVLASEEINTGDTHNILLLGAVSLSSLVTLIACTLGKSKKK
ncbi:MAG: hypothetical protein IIV51_08610 [Lachnospiraceae bacterium]|nr:hypothetical protein [Lachnospiraceae bacterium]